MTNKIDYTEHIVSFVSVVLAALSISTLDRCVYHPDLISFWAILLFILGTFFISIINVEKMLEYVSSKGVYISLTHSYLQRFIPKIDDYKFWIFSIMNSVLISIVLMILINLVAKIVFIVFNVLDIDWDLKNWLLRYEWIIKLIIYFLMPMVIVMIVSYFTHDILHREDLKNKLVVWFNVGEILELYSDEPKDVVLYLRNLSEELVQIKNIKIELPKDVVLIEKVDEFEGTVDLKDIDKERYCLALTPMKTHGIILELRYEPETESQKVKSDIIRFVIETDKFEKEVILPVKLKNY